ncbi:MAG: 5-formyltetrahydrofolate cyclo-ligase [Prevotella sp.]|nr:5-formyltetrahydrofolate cyclo-ligase [Prevotella sp.]
MGLKSMTTKQALRQLIRQRKQQHSTGESVAVIALLKENPRFSLARTLLLYSALPDEVQTQPLLDQLSAEGKTVLLPRVTSDTDMELRCYTGAADLQKGAFGIMEPIGEVFTDYATIDVAIVPGMAFDPNGHRLGRGKGYYDRFLARIPHVYKIGLCFVWQLVDCVPTDANDIMMDCVVSQNARL